MQLFLPSTVVKRSADAATSLFTFLPRNYIVRKTQAHSSARPENQQKKIEKYGIGKNEARGSAGRTSAACKKWAAVGLEAPPESKKMPQMLSHSSNADANVSVAFSRFADGVYCGES